MIAFGFILAIRSFLAPNFETTVESRIQKRFFYLAYCFGTTAYCFYLLLSQKLSVPVSYKMVSYMRDYNHLNVYCTWRTVSNKKMAQGETIPT